MNDNTSLGQQVLETIEKNNITPKPKWHFLVREGVVWGVVAVAFFVGTIATCLTIYILNASRFIERHSIDAAYLFASIPFLWLFLLVVGVGYSVHAFRETRRGYTWGTSWLVGLAVCVSIFMGISLHLVGAGAVIDRYLLAQVPVYGPLTNFEPHMWMNAERGVIAGTITKISGPDRFTLTRFDGVTLEVVIKDANIPVFNVYEGMRVRMVGTTTVRSDTEVFEVYEIVPFRGRGGGMRARHEQVGPGTHMIVPMKEN